MSSEQIQRDVLFLTEELPHRGASTVHERQAAEYLRDRFAQHTEDVTLDDFYAVESRGFLFAAYYAEFAVVALVAHWFPRVALVYCALVFLLYLAESNGFHILGRLLPHFETQNVEARFLSAQPKRLVIVAANYDTPKIGPLPKTLFERWRRPLHKAAVVAMLTVFVSCAIQGFGVAGPEGQVWNLAARWGAVTLLVAAAGLIALHEFAADFEPVRGNAQGVAVLLELAQRIQDKPLSTADLWLVATGSKEAGLNGMRRLLEAGDFDPETTHFVNVDLSHTGSLHYVKGEGALHRFAASRRLCEAAQSHQAGAIRTWGAASDALIPLARGYQAMSIINAGPGDEKKPRDRSHGAAEVLHAADFVEAIARELDTSPDAL